MLEESLELLAVQPGRIWVDATAGSGGHLREIVRLAGGSGQVLAIDRDGQAIANLQSRASGNVTFVQANYADLESILAARGIATVDGGIFADLGVSSMQLDQAERGFSFTRDGPLDMRMDPLSKTTAATLVNTLKQEDLADLIYRYGEERYSRRIARRIVERRPLKTTLELAQIVAASVPIQRSAKHRDTSHPATRTFQALRIAVNDELASLEKFLRSAIRCLAPGARLVVITFHSLEDRLVKQIFKEAASPCICPGRQPVCTCNHKPELLIITRKPVVPSQKEVLANPRSRSAKLRAGEKRAQ